MEEEWKQYKDTKYEISNMGKVRNKETGKELKQNKKNGKEHDYMKVHLSIGGITVVKSVHRIVMEVFEGGKELEIDHKNGIRDDNRLDNLEYVTREENYRRYVNNGGNNQRIPIKATNIDNKEELHFKSLWEAGKYLKNKHGKSTIDHYCANIKQNISGKTKRAYGYIWELE